MQKCRFILLKRKNYLGYSEIAVIRLVVFCVCDMIIVGHENKQYTISKHTPCNFSFLICIKLFESTYFVKLLSHRKYY